MDRYNSCKFKLQLREVSEVENWHSVSSGWMSPCTAELNTYRFKTPLTAALLIEGHLLIPWWPARPSEIWPRGGALHIGPWFESSLSLAFQVRRGQTWAWRLSGWTYLRLNQQNLSSETLLTKSIFSPTNNARKYAVQIQRNAMQRNQMLWADTPKL